MTTNATKHTPGPWRVNAIKGNRIVGDETAPQFDKLQINNSNMTVATVYRPRDARLIASAPELLAERDRLRAENTRLREALRVACDHMEAALQGDPRGKMAPTPPALDEARAALAAKE